MSRTELAEPVSEAAPAASALLTERPKRTVRTGPLVSVVLATYDRAPLLKNAIDQVVQQTWPHWELLIMDDGSTDATVLIGEEAQEQIEGVRYFRLPHRGVSHARNRGIELSRGEYVAFLDDDDEWLPDKLKRQVALLEKNRALGFVYTQSEIRFDGGLGYLRIPLSLTFKDLLGRNTIAVPSVMARRTTLISSGGFNEDMSASEDVDLWLRLALSCDFGALPDVQVVCHQSRLRYAQRAEEALRNHFRTLRELARIASSREDRRMIQLERACKYHKLAVERRDQGRYAEALHGYLLALWLDPAVGYRWGNQRGILLRACRPYFGLVYTLIAGCARALQSRLWLPRRSES